MLPITGRTESIALVSEAPGVHRIWHWQNVMVVSWHGKPSAEAARMLGTTADQLFTRFGFEKLSYLHLIQNKLELPDADTRTALVELAQAYGDRTACVAVVVGGSGFWASAMRSFVTGIRVLAPGRVDIRMYGAIPELIEKFPEAHASKTGVTLDPSELRRQLEDIQAE